MPRRDKEEVQPRSVAIRIGKRKTWATYIRDSKAGLPGNGATSATMVDDRLGDGLAIGYSVLMSIPSRREFALLVGAPVSGSPAFESRMYVAHVFLFPILTRRSSGCTSSLSRRGITRSSARAGGRRRRRFVGIPTFPGQAPRSLGLFFAVAAVLFLLGGLVQINPIWLWGPYHVAQERTAPSRTGTSAG